MPVFLAIPAAIMLAKQVRKQTKGAVQRLGQQNRRADGRPAPPPVSPAALRQLEELQTPQLVDLLRNAVSAARNGREALRGVAGDVRDAIEANQPQVDAVLDQAGRVLGQLRATVDDPLAKMNRAYERTTQEVGLARDALLEARRNPGARQGIVARLLGTVEQFRAYAGYALTQNAGVAGAIWTILADRAASAAERLADGGGDAFEAFWGKRPGDAIGDIWDSAFTVLLGGAALVGLGLLVLTTPGGQALLVGQGAGAAKMGAGYGKLLGGTGTAAARLVG